MSLWLLLVIFILLLAFILAAHDIAITYIRVRYKVKKEKVRKWHDPSFGNGMGEWVTSYEYED